MTTNPANVADTVFNDLAKDTLTGGPSKTTADKDVRDWFFAIPGTDPATDVLKDYLAAKDVLDPL